MTTTNQQQWNVGAVHEAAEAAEAETEFGGDLHDYRTGEYIRPATEAETRESREAARSDGGAGVIEIDGRRCYVQE